jgi:tRNA-2-methylthio-N6-dimethylallyladenosine synthase
MACFGQLSKLCEHIHLPVQAGSNAILGRMNRRYTREIYLEKIQALRDRCPTIAVTSDVIVGFPGETREDFERTLELLQTVRFDDLFSFKYSDRPLTRARLFPEQVEAEEKGLRLKKLQAFQKEVTLARNKALEGTVQSVLVDGFSKKSPLEWTGRTRTNKVVNFSGPPELLGRTLPVKIEKAALHSLKGSTQLKDTELEQVHGN